MKNLDRFGEERCQGYNKQDFELCPKCVPSGDVIKAKLSPKCKICGGYGEIPKRNKYPKGINTQKE